MLASWADFEHLYLDARGVLWKPQSRVIKFPLYITDVYLILLNYLIFIDLSKGDVLIS